MSLINAAVVAVLALNPSTELANKCRMEGDIAATMTYGRNRGLSFSDTLEVLDRQGLLLDLMHVALVVYTLDGAGPREAANYVEQGCLEYAE